MKVEQATTERMATSRPTLTDPEEYQLIHDIYMDPDKPLLGEDGKEMLERRKTRDSQSKMSSR